ncbi:amino acid ABC transporter permease [Clostridium cylindrosporum]|uniref:Putative glutamine ABC transporter permease protein GlnM n=1 Tax=Clostridium cylindrosporum DSM 605 TaxID=1121307 RepID=A0A0J8G2P0_CLOCY|nr:amino acid ABC transporter permease [Clostridium cylindrosporum]KMT21986.1 putative glutamine ABC transporter permease protein GlnM [Clostridium cylindrosporum DSM 605]
MNLDLSFMQKHIPVFIDASILTFQIALIAIALSIGIAIMNNFIYQLNIKPLSFIVKAYVEVARNTPFLIQLFFLYFVLPTFGIKLSGFVAATIGLSFLGGGYMTESFRAGIEAISKPQIESGLSIGLSRFELLKYVILPQAVNISIPALITNAIFLLKETSVASAIAVPELLHTTTGLIAIYYKTYEMLLMLTIFYVVLFVPISLLLSFLERRMKYGQYGA